ncbi:MAG: amidohydrolase family protein [Erysipelotrichaceae bacterium]|nr:amidohydrolase family protein [Erysipelotrichaceae bacterium]
MNSCTLNPARLLKLDHRKGQLQAGMDADIVILDNDYQVIQTYARGRECL